MKKVLVVVDMQNDFIDGALGTKEAQAIVGRVIEKIKEYPEDCIYATRDTHEEDYLETSEEKTSPFPTASVGAKAGRSGKRSGQPCPMR